MRRVAFKMKLKPGCRDEYKKRHDEIWPELAALLHDAGVRDFSIFLDEATDTLFAVQKLTGGSGSQDLGTNPVVRRWWSYMAPLMETNPDSSPISIPLTELFRLE